MWKALTEELIINVTFHSMLQDIKDYFRISFGSDLICNKILKVISSRVWGRIYIFYDNKYTIKRMCVWNVTG